MTENALEHAEVEVPSVLAAQYSSRSSLAPNAISEAMGAAFGTLMAYVGQHGLAPAGAPRAIYTAYGQDGLSFTVAMPLAEPPGAAAEPGPVTMGEIPGGRALRFTHRGPYRELMSTYGRITEFMKAQGLLENEADWARYMPMWEEYLNDPATTPEAELMTYIYVPLR